MRRPAGLLTVVIPSASPDVSSAVQEPGCVVVGRYLLNLNNLISGRERHRSRYCARSLCYAPSDEIVSVNQRCRGSSVSVDRDYIIHYRISRSVRNICDTSGAYSCACRPVRFETHSNGNGNEYRSEDSCSFNATRFPRLPSVEPVPCCRHCRSYYNIRYCYGIVNDAVRRAVVNLYALYVDCTVPVRGERYQICVDGPACDYRYIARYHRCAGCNHRIVVEPAAECVARPCRRGKFAVGIACVHCHRTGRY